MKTIWKQIKHFKLTLVATTLTISISGSAAQGIRHKSPQEYSRQPKRNHSIISKQRKQFELLAAQANVTFVFPTEFKEIKVPDDEDLSFDYGIELPGKEFEIWFQIKPQKENWASFEKAKNANATRLDNPDSLYAAIGAAEALAFTGERNYLVKDIPADYLARYNANAGKSFLLTLLDSKATKHYKYALLFALQKFHTGIIFAVCFTNDKGPEFFKNINKAAGALKFTPQI